jgi:hypothetical protein
MLLVVPSALASGLAAMTLSVWSSTIQLPLLPIPLCCAQYLIQC